MKLPTTPKFVASSNGTRRTNSYSAPPIKLPKKVKVVPIVEEFCLCRVIPIQFVHNQDNFDWLYVPRINDHMLEDAIKDLKYC